MGGGGQAAERRLREGSRWLVVSARRRRAKCGGPWPRLPHWPLLCPLRGPASPLLRLPLCDRPSLPTLLGPSLRAGDCGEKTQGRAVSVTSPSLSPPLASSGSPESRLSPRRALSFQGAALHGLFLDASMSWPPRPGDQLVRGSGSFKLLILFSRKLLTLWFKHFF